MSVLEDIVNAVKDLLGTNPEVKLEDVAEALAKEAAKDVVTWVEKRVGVAERRRVATVAEPPPATVAESPATPFGMVPGTGQIAHGFHRDETGNVVADA